MESKILRKNHGASTCRNENYANVLLLKPAAHGIPLSLCLSLAAALDSLDQMARVQLSSLSSLASRAALVSSVVMATGISLPLYAVSYDYVESVFLSFLEQMGR